MSIRLRDKDRRRRQHETCAGADRPTATPGDSSDLAAAVDEELHRLPDRYRALVVACDLEGHLQQDVARELGLSLSTLRRRLDRGRDLLRTRLAARGLGLAALGPVWLCVSIAPTLASHTVEAALHFANGQSSSATSAVLAEGVLTMMTRTKIVSVVGAVVVLTVALFGGGAAWYMGTAASGQPSRTASTTPSKAATDPPPPVAKGTEKATEPAPVKYLIKPGDRLTIKARGVFEPEPIDGHFLVEPEGTIVLAPAYGGRCHIAGRTLVQAEEILKTHLRKYARFAEATITRFDPGPEAHLEARVIKLEQEVKELRSLVAELRKKP